MASQALYLAPGLALDGLPRATGPGLVGFVSGAAQVAAYARAAAVLDRDADDVAGRPFAEVLACEALAGLGAAGVTLACLQSAGANADDGGDAQHPKAGYLDGDGTVALFDHPKVSLLDCLLGTHTNAELARSPSLIESCLFSIDCWLIRRVCVPAATARSSWQTSGTDACGGSCLLAR